MYFTKQELEELMQKDGGGLDLRDTGITRLPEGLTVGGNLDLRFTPITTLPEGLSVGGWLNLSGTGITSLPEGLTVGGWLDLSNTGITSLPEGLTVGGWLDLSNTGITSLPEGLTVGGDLALRNTPITALPEGLTVGGNLYLSGTGITNIPQELKKIKILEDGDYVEGKYIYADSILTHIARKKTVGNYTVYIGTIKGRNVVTDGKNYAHCNKLRDGIADLQFKAAKERGAEQYEGLSLDTELTVAEMVEMYRVITGACRQGAETFVNSIKDLKEKYTIREAIEMTKGQYNAQKFAEFFVERDEI